MPDIISKLPITMAFKARSPILDYLFLDMTNYIRLHSLLCITVQHVFNRFIFFTLLKSYQMYVVMYLLFFTQIIIISIVMLGLSIHRRNVAICDNVDCVASCITQTCVSDCSFNVENVAKRNSRQI